MSKKYVYLLVFIALLTSIGLVIYFTAFSTRSKASFGSCQSTRACTNDSQCGGSNIGRCIMSKQATIGRCSCRINIPTPTPVRKIGVNSYALYPLTGENPAVGDQMQFRIAIETADKIAYKARVGLSYNNQYLKYDNALSGNAMPNIFIEKTMISNHNVLIVNGTNKSGFVGNGDLAIVTFRILQIPLPGGLAALYMPSPTVIPTISLTNTPIPISTPSIASPFPTSAPTSTPYPTSCSDSVGTINFVGMCVDNSSFKQLSFICNNGFKDQILSLDSTGCKTPNEWLSIVKGKCSKQCDVDITIRNLTAELSAGVARYFTLGNNNPFFNCIAPNCPRAEKINTPQMSQFINSILDKNELKPSFITEVKPFTDKIFFTTTSQSNSPKICFMPGTSAMQSNSNTKFTIEGELQTTPACQSSGVKGGAYCYWCMR